MQKRLSERKTERLREYETIQRYMFIFRINLRPEENAANTDFFYCEA